MCLYTGDLKALASQTTSLWCNTLGWNGWSCILSADRSTHPAYGLMVLNRLSSENFVQHITPDLPIHIQPPFVLFSRQSSSEFPLFGWNVLGNMYWNALGFFLFQYAHYWNYNPISISTIVFVFSFHLFFLVLFLIFLYQFLPGWFVVSTVIITSMYRKGEDCITLVTSDLAVCQQVWVHFCVNTATFS